MNEIEFLLENRRRNIIHLLSIITSVFLIDFTESVPPNYCFPPLNTSDCNGPPIGVFYYYKPGSRCEQAIWRGCPTFNMFPDEFICIHTCIAKYIPRALPHVTVRGNNIEDITTTVKPVDQLKIWEVEIDKLKEDEANDIIDILDDVIAKLNPVKKKLKFTLTSGKTTTPMYNETTTVTSTTETTNGTKSQQEETTTSKTTQETTSTSTKSTTTTTSSSTSTTTKLPLTTEKATTSTTIPTTETTTTTTVSTVPTTTNLPTSQQMTTESITTTTLLPTTVETTTESITTTTRLPTTLLTTTAVTSDGSGDVDEVITT